MRKIVYFNYVFSENVLIDKVYTNELDKIHGPPTRACSVRPIINVKNLIIIIIMHI